MQQLLKPASSGLAPTSVPVDYSAILGPQCGESDSLITRALMVGRFDSAVALCLQENRLADALAIAISGGWVELPAVALLTCTGLNC